MKKPAIDWYDTHDQQELVSALVNDALALLDALDVAAIPVAGGRGQKPSPRWLRWPARTWTLLRIG
ncbi:hypothetical protein [Corynebacterium pacaense]|uniref:hypothetical protein n=1 Tax=Corynebacterium pacaense TaxID=1816684 RepID=UPI0009BB7D4E|nr:hypothetical protein [Corynebacterium pacaense]